MSALDKMTIQEVEEELDFVEPHRHELSDLWRKHAGHVDEQGLQTFREELNDKWPAWNYSPTAQVLVALSYFREGRFEVAEEHLNEADRAWGVSARHKGISPTTYAALVHRLAICRAKVLLGMKDEDTAFGFLHGQQERLANIPELSTSHRDALMADMDCSINRLADVDIAALACPASA